MVTVLSDQTSYEWGSAERRSFDGDTYWFVAFDEESAAQRADLFEALWMRLDGFETVKNKNSVPTKVACAGKAAIATYLSCVHLMSTSEISDSLRVSISTVEQYISDVKSGRRL